MSSSSSNVIGSLTAMEERIAQLERELAEEGTSDSDDFLEEEEQRVRPPPPKKQRATPPDALRRPSATTEPGAQPLSLHCAICDKKVTSEKLMHEHLSGRAHKSMLARAENRYCVCCKVEFTSSRQLEDHCKGRKHKDKERQSLPPAAVSKGS